MARPTKQTVDYFPHYSTHGKTIYILEQRYQSKGYAFWFKLLEELCSHNGHFIDLNDESEIEFLSAKTGFLSIETLEVLDLLAKINAIDSKLWQKRVIWSQNLVNNIADAYKNRKTKIPEKPVSMSRNPVSSDRNPSDAEVSIDRNPHIKLNNTILNKNKLYLGSSFLEEPANTSHTSSSSKENNPEEKNKKSRSSHQHVIMLEDIQQKTTWEELLEFWNEREIIIHKSLSPLVIKYGEKLLKEMSVLDMKKSIQNYADIFHNPKCFFKYRWTLHEFLQRENGCRTFLYKTEDDFLTKQKQNYEG